MTTQAQMRHKLVIGKLIADPSASLYSIMRSVGYAHHTAKQPGRTLLSQPGFQSLLEEYLPDSLLLEALQTDIKDKKGNRKGELELAFKVKGRLNTQDQPPAQNTYNTFIGENNINPNTPSAQELVKTTLDVLMAQTKRKVVPNEH